MGQYARVLTSGIYLCGLLMFIEFMGDNACKT